LKKYIIGDLHGNFKALMQVLRKVNFDYEEDHLYFIGDLADKWPDAHLCLLEMLKIKNFFPIMGNHDLFLKKWLYKNTIDERWLKCNGEETMKMFAPYLDELDSYFKKCQPYRIYKDTFICHAGFNHHRLITKQKKLTFSINRRLYKTSQIYKKQGIKIKVIYDEKNKRKLNNIIIGHSPTKNYLPEYNVNLINIDTGAGNGGKLTILDLDNPNKYWQSGNKLYEK